MTPVPRNTRDTQEEANSQESAELWQQRRCRRGSTRHRDSVEKTQTWDILNRHQHTINSSFQSSFSTGANLHNNSLCFNKVEQKQEVEERERRKKEHKLTGFYLVMSGRTFIWTKNFIICSNTEKWAWNIAKGGLVWTLLLEEVNQHWVPEIAT